MPETQPQSLTLQGPEPIDLSVVSHRSTLERLELTAGYLSDGLAPLADAHLPQLQALTLMETSGVTSLRGLETLSTLRELQLYGVEELEDISALTDLKGLQRLHIADAPWIEEMHPIGALTALRELRLSGVPALEVTAWHGLQRLEHLDLRAPTQEHLDMVPLLGSLQSLHVLAASHLKCLPDDWKAASGLRQLVIDRAPALTHIESLAQLIHLEHLILRSLRAVHDFSPIQACHALHTLNLDDLPHLNDIAWTDKLPSLQHLHTVRIPALS